MNSDKPILYATLVKPSAEETRHLLIFFVDGPANTRLVQFSAGSEAEIDTGTEYEMKQKADALARTWISDEGFKRPDKFAFEPLDRTTALAMKMGFTFILDPGSRKTDRPPINLTGAVSLAAWPGMIAQNGGTYVYALDRMTLHARPTLPKSHVLNTGRRDPKNNLAYLTEYAEAIKSVGRAADFVLGGD